MHDFLIRNRASIWLCFVVLIISATMMHPGFASMVSLLVECGVLFLLRYIAHIEGRHGEVMAFWKTTSRVNPIRADGRPNRPLTAFTIEPVKIS